MKSNREKNILKSWAQQRQAATWGWNPSFRT